MSGDPSKASEAHAQADAQTNESVTPEVAHQTADAQAPEHGVEDTAANADHRAQTGDGAEQDSLENQLESLRMQLAEREDALLRMQAELENQRRRAQRDVENAHKFGIEKFVAELLPVKDSMELGLASGGDSEVAAIREGVELTDKMLGSALEKFGVKQIDPTGETFNPELHQAMSIQEGGELGPGKVLTVFQKGYLLNERLVRPAMVIVSK